MLTLNVSIKNEGCVYNVEAQRSAGGGLLMKISKASMAGLHVLVGERKKKKQGKYYYKNSDAVCICAGSVIC